jgi:protein-tyrosine-phosphatase
MSKLQVLFVCIENVGRSQMAEGFFREYAPKFEVASAGTEQKSELNPIVVDTKKEIGIDITNQIPKLFSN